MTLTQARRHGGAPGDRAPMGQLLQFSPLSRKQAGTFCNSCFFYHVLQTFCQLNVIGTRSSAIAEIARDADVGAHSLSL